MLAEELQPSNDAIQVARVRPRRTMIYVSGDIDRHIAKAIDLPADSIIYDLHEPIAPQFKTRGRDKLRQAILNGQTRGQERVLRINPPQSPWFDDDIALAAQLPVDAVLFTGVQSAEELLDAQQRLDRAGGDELPVMVMVETPLAVLNIAAIAAASERLCCLVASNANLSASMRLRPSPDRTGLFTPLAMIVLAARAHGLAAVDGAHLDITEPHSCEYACRQSRDFGFDGKAVIHPVQLAYTNDAFTPMPKEVERKREIIRLMEEANSQGRSYAMLESRLLQPSELEAARRCLAHHEAVERRMAMFDAGQET